VESLINQARSPKVKWDATIELVKLDPAIGRIRLLGALERPPESFLEDIKSLPVELRNEVDEWTADMQNCPLQTLSHRVVNPEIVRGYERNSQQRRDQIDHYMRFLPRRLRSSAADFSGVEGGGNDLALQSGELSYQHWVMTKA
jgi:hypothetical protein